jgi:hypothetical protein
MMKKTLLIAVPSFLVGISTGFANPAIDPAESAFSGAAFQMAADTTDQVDPSIEGFDSQDQTGLTDEPRTDELNVETDGGSISGTEVDVEGFDGQDQTGLTDEPRTEDMGLEEGASASEVDPSVEGFESQDHSWLEDNPRTEELGAEEE